MMRNISILLMLLCCYCSPKQNEPLASDSSYDTSFVTIGSDTANTYFESSVVVSRASRTKLAAKEDLKHGPSLYQTLQQLQEGNVFEAKIINDKDTILSLPHRTRLLIPANAFRTKSENANVIEIYVQEYYSLADIISANLTTTSEENILETGGMIYITASSNGEECILNNGKEIQISFPFNVSKPGMQLFTGTPDSLNRIVWEPSPVEETDLEESVDTFTVAEQMPEFPGGYEALVRHLNKNLKYPADARRLGIQGIVFVKFIVDESGSVINPSVLQGVYKSIDKSAIDAISTMPKWVPGSCEGRPVNVTMSLPIRFFLDGTRLPMASNARNPYTDRQIKNFGENMSDSTLKRSAVDEVSYYILKTAKLGWINCDRFIDAKDRVTYKVYIANGPRDDVDVKLIFQNIRSIFPGNRVGNFFYFPNVPKNEQAEILAFHGSDRGLEMTSKKVIINSHHSDSLLAFQPITIAKLKDYLKALDNN